MWFVSAPFTGLVAVYYWRHARQTALLLYHEIVMLISRHKLKHLRQLRDQLNERLTKLADRYAVVSPRE
jgi:hypothetical protein